MAHADMPLPRTEANRRFLDLRRRPGNERCAECHAMDTSWLVIDYGVMICLQCAGAHRGLGTHISKVRSTELDNFTHAEFEWIEALSNAKSALLYEAALPPTMRRPSVSAPDVIRRWWLRQKYDELLFTAGQNRTAAGEHERLRGWLLKQGSVLPTFRRRFFVIVGGAQLCCYNDSDLSSFRSAFALAGAELHVDPV